LSLIINFKKILGFWFFETRILIALHYLFLTICGVLLSNRIFEKPINPYPAILICLAIFFAYQTSIVVNDLNDLKTDSISKKKTPLSNGEISLIGYQKLGVLYFLLSIFLAFMINYQTLLMLLIIHSLHYFYSSPPFRLKRFWPVSVFMLALGALFAAIAGYMIYESSKPFLSFPLKPALLIVLPLFLALNFRDLTDYEGDKNTEVATLYTVLGLEKGRTVNALLILLSYLLVPIILQYPILFFASVPLGILSFYFCLRKPFQERYIFFFYFILLVILAITLNLKPEIIIG